MSQPQYRVYIRVVDEWTNFDWHFSALRPLITAALKEGYELSYEPNHNRSVYATEVPGVALTKPGDLDPTFVIREII